MVAWRRKKNGGTERKKLVEKQRPGVGEGMEQWRGAIASAAAWWSSGMRVAPCCSQSGHPWRNDAYILLGALTNGHNGPSMEDES